VSLKPQDSLLLVKYWSLNQKSQRLSVREIAQSIGISLGEVSKSSKRLIESKLAVERSGVVFAEKGAVLEWLSFGVRYMYPQIRSGYGRGVATAWSCPILQSEVLSPSPAIVWPAPGGDTEGELVQPLHGSIPVAAINDEGLYRVFSLVEVIRGGKPRELNIARRLLKELIQQG
jgi:DNA-binding Lrp family transcriptional regulator